jgi:phospholipid N-methyltransferase
MGRMSDLLLFASEFARSFQSTGAVAPSGRSLGRALSRYVHDRPAERPLSILEVGAGTGAVTRVIAGAMRAEDRLAVVECNPRFCHRLRAALTTDPALRAVAGRIGVLDRRVEELPGDARYDVIISGLPFANFSAVQVSRILERFAEMSRPGGYVSFFSYAGTTALKSLLSTCRAATGRPRPAQVAGDWIRRYGVHSEMVFANVPPAWVHHTRPAA